MGSSPTTRTKQKSLTSVRLFFSRLFGEEIALAIDFSSVEAGTGANVTNPFLVKMLNIGVASFGLMVPVLAGFIAEYVAR